MKIRINHKKINENKKQMLSALFAALLITSSLGALIFATVPVGGVVPPTIEFCQHASEVISYEPGLQNNDEPILSERQDPEKALGEPENDDTLNFVSLGFGGTLILKFDNLIVNDEGWDFEIIETSYGNPSAESYPERIRVYASMDNTDWVFIGETIRDNYTPGASANAGQFDLGSLPWAQYIKIIDNSNPEDFTGKVDGYDVDGVNVRYCAIPYTLTVSIDPEGSGSVSIDPDYPIYAEGTTVSLEASALEGWSFHQWSGDLSGSTNPETILMDSDKTVTAHFKQDEIPRCDPQIDLPEGTITLFAWEFPDEWLSAYKIELADISGNHEVMNGIYNGWCIDYGTPIPNGEPQTVNLYSSYDPPEHLTHENWSKLNYLINHPQGDAFDVQRAIWYFINFGSWDWDDTGYMSKPVSDETWNMVDDAIENGDDWCPDCGDKIAIISEPDDGVQITILEAILCEENPIDDEDEEDDEVDCSDNNPPIEPHSPNPSDGSVLNKDRATLSYKVGDPDVSQSVTYKNYFGTSNPPEYFGESTWPAETPGFTTNFGPITPGTTYYWQIVAIDECEAITEGPIWSFTAAESDDDDDDEDEDEPIDDDEEDDEDEDEPIDDDEEEKTTPKKRSSSSSKASVKTPPIAIISEPFEYTVYDQPIILDGSSSYSPDSDNHIVSYDWNLGDGTKANGETISHEYKKAGSFYVTLTVWDNQGSKDSVSEMITIEQPNRAPIEPLISGIFEIIGEQGYSFAASSTDPDGDDIKYTFDWGDETSESSEFLSLPKGSAFSIIHTWDEPGDYTITVTVTDGELSSSSEIELKVLPVPIDPMIVYGILAAVFALSFIGIFLFLKKRSGKPVGQ